MMRRNYFSLSSVVGLICLAISYGCASSGGSEQGAVLGAAAAVKIVSEIPEAAAKGDERSKAVWCGALRVAECAGGENGKGEIEADCVRRSDNPAQEIYDLGRNNGMSLHMMQVRQLFKDATQVYQAHLKGQDTAEYTRCQN